MTSTQSTTSVVIADSQPCFAFALRACLSMHSSELEIDSCVSPGNAMEALAKSEPDLLLLECDADWPSGLAIAAQIRNVYPLVKVVVTVSTDLSGTQAAQILALRPAGCLSKQMLVPDLIDALRLVAAGAVIISPVHSSSLSDTDNDPLQSLSDHERDLLRLITEGLNNTQLASRLCVSDATLKRQMHRVKLKLQVENRVQAAVLAVKERLL